MVAPPRRAQAWSLCARWVDLVSTLVGLALLAGIATQVNWAFVRAIDFGALWEYREALAIGLGLTLLTTAIAVGGGLDLGVILAIGLHMPFGILRWIILAYVEIWRNTPLIVQLFWVHFAFPLVTGLSTSALVSGVIAISMQASAYLTDIVRAGIQTVPRGQWEAANALGVPGWSRRVDVILPQALKIMIPPLANVSISFFKTTAILGVLSVGELMTTAYRVAEYGFKPVETFTFAAAVYFVLGTLFSAATHRLEKATLRS